MTFFLIILLLLCYWVYLECKPQPKDPAIIEIESRGNKFVLKSQYGYYSTVYEVIGELYKGDKYGVWMAEKIIESFPERLVTFKSAELAQFVKISLEKLRIDSDIRIISYND